MKVETGHRRSAGSYRWLAAALSIGALAGAASLAVAGVRRSLIESRCHDEIAKLCEEVKPGGGRLARCLRNHDAELSNDCKAALAASWAGRAPAKK